MLTGPVTVPVTVAGTGPAEAAIDRAEAAIGPAGVVTAAAEAIAVGAAVAIADCLGRYPSRVNSVT